jgi:predicted hydrocarbon binding protein/KaiC/GvpD/RAD55 family RecA-like ATPase
VEARGLSLAEIQEVPRETLILVAGPPGAGKSGFCDRAVLNGVAMDKPVIFVTTEQRPGQVVNRLRERGMGEAAPEMLSFVDAFSQTVGVETPGRPDTIYANCVDLNSISIATTRLQERMGRRGILLAFDSLTSPYLLSGAEVTRFMRLFLSKFAAEGNSVLALMDEGCGKEEDLGAMMSIADGIIKMEIKEKSRIVHVVKHSKVAPASIETPMTWSPVLPHQRFDPRVLKGEMQQMFSAPAKPLRTETQDDFINVFWKNLASWSGMLWDPKRFPVMAYELDKEAHASFRELIPLLPWRMRLLFRLLSPPSNFSEIKDMRRFLSRFSKITRRHGYGVLEYLEDMSKEDEHYLRIYENCSCWGFDNVGAGLGFHQCGEWAGGLVGMEKEERDWNVMETKCIGLGDPYCEFKVVPGQISELKESLESIDSSIVGKVHDRLMDQLVGFLVHGKPLPERPRMGSRIFFEEMHHVTGAPALFSERYRVALQMGGAKAGKEVGEHLMEAGVMGDEALERVVNFMEYCKVGKIDLGEMITMKENCETFGLQPGEPSCFFTTGFLNGLLSAVKGQHVREVKCIAAGDPYCEWQIM